MSPNFTTYRTIKVSRQDRHVVVSLARPQKSNSMDDCMWQEIPQVIISQGSIINSIAGLQLMLLLQLFQELDAMDDVYAVCVLS